VSVYSASAGSGRISSSSSSGYGTISRPVSLPFSRQQRLLSSSDPDLPSINPTSPENTDASTAYSG